MKKEILKLEKELLAVRKKGEAICQKFINGEIPIGSLCMDFFDEVATEEGILLQDFMDKAKAKGPKSTCIANIVYFGYNETGKILSLEEIDKLIKMNN